jgi:hypothetical protein
MGDERSFEVYLALRKSNPVSRVAGVNVDKTDQSKFYRQSYFSNDTDRRRAPDRPALPSSHGVDARFTLFMM